jgi:hypothetical protein
VTTRPNPNRDNALASTLLPPPLSIIKQSFLFNVPCYDFVLPLIPPYEKKGRQQQQKEIIANPKT